MSEKLEPSMPFIVRITGAAAAGLGFCVDEMHIVTCAHVVKEVLGLDDYPRERPEGTLRVEFPYAAGATRSARVVDWHPRVSEAGRTDDIAVLALDNTKPDTVPAAELLRNKKLFGHPFWALGYTASNPAGIWSHGEMCPPLPIGRLQVENPKDRGISIEYGFSGTPVWDEELHGVVGMVVEASLTRAQGGAIVGEGIAFVIPNDALVEAWPDLEKISTPDAGKIKAPPAYESNNRGISLANLGRYEEALTCFDHALAIDPRYAIAWTNRGISLANLGRFEEAITCFDHALAIDPRIRSAWTNKGISLVNSGRFEEAITCFDHALAIDPRYAIAWTNKGRSLYTLGRYEEAITCFDHALAIDPRYAIALFNKGVSLCKLGRFEEAVPCLEQAYAIDPHVADV